MQSCLGLYIEDNVIKYAKTSKERETVKIESYGVKFFDDLEKAISQIVTETFSFKTPISTNLTDEQYAYSNVFSLLNKKDLEKAINTEFDYFCNEKSKNRNAIEYRRLLLDNYQDRDKLGVMYAYVDKASIVSRLQTLDGYRVNSVVPLPIAIKSLNNFGDKRNCIIINIEDKTTITTIINGKIYRINMIEEGMRQILDAISLKENSYAKAYEICKNTTIYTAEGQNLQVEENEYLEDIMPTLYSIVEKVKEIIIENEVEIEDVYITGAASVINNIDLYFQEKFPDKKCEILTPFFANKSNLKINIKDYIEVNSAIALSLEGLGLGTKEANFKHNRKLEEMLAIDFGKGGKKGNKTEKTGKMSKLFKLDLSGGLDNIERWLLRSGIAVLLLIIVYIAFEKTLMFQINKKDKEVQIFLDDSQAKIAEVEKYSNLLNTRKGEYQSLIEQIDEQNARISEINAKKNAIPNLLNKIMFVIPKEVQLLSITNTTGKTIQIEAQAKKYEQLGYFIAGIKNEGILLDVTSTAGTKTGELVKVTITGNLNY
ncbi:MAG: hypothetical protein ACI4UX_01800 [Clostridia bacterium]